MKFAMSVHKLSETFLLEDGDLAWQPIRHVLLTGRKSLWSGGVLGRVALNSEQIPLQNRSFFFVLYDKTIFFYSSYELDIKIIIYLLSYLFSFI